MCVCVREKIVTILMSRVLCSRGVSVASTALMSRRAISSVAFSQPIRNNAHHANRSRNRLYSLRERRHAHTTNNTGIPQASQQMPPKDNRTTLPINLLLGLVLGAAVAGAIDYVLFFPEPAEKIFELAQENQEVVAVLGSPITRSYFWDGKVTGDDAFIKLPVSGPNGAGIVTSRLVKDPKTGKWDPLMLIFHPKDGKLINLQPTKEAAQKHLGPDAMAATAAAHGGVIEKV